MKLCSGEISFVLQLQTCESQDQQEEPCPPAQPQVSNPSSDTQTESNHVLSSSSCNSSTSLHLTLLPSTIDLFHSTWPCITLPGLSFTLHYSTLLYHGSTSLFYYTLVLLFYLTLHYPYPGSTSLYFILNYSTMAVLHSTLLYISLPLLYFTLFYSTLLYHGRVM